MKKPLKRTRYMRPNRREVLWHGTSSIVTPRILTEGFVPAPRHKRWGPETGYRASFYGSYFTNNWMTAYSAAGNAVDTFGGERVIFEVQIELRTALIDEDHLPDGPTFLAHANNRSFILTKDAFEILTEPELKKYGEKFIENGVQDYWRQLEWDLVRTRDNHLRQEAHDALYPFIWNYMYETLWAAANIYDPHDPWHTSREYSERRDETPAVRKARADLILKMRGLVNKWPPEAFNIRNVRIDQPIRFRGANKILNAVRIDEPSEDGQQVSATIDNPYELVALYGCVSENFIEQFYQHITGDRRKIVVVQGA